MCCQPVHGIKKTALQNITLKERKIIVFGSIGAGYSSGKFENNEKRLITHIFNLPQIKVEYIAKFSKTVGKILSINKEAIDLINE